ncbi:acylneuraminate cytidylyltransferase family protein [Herbaspirillum sp. NPDC101397]|uniref:acylneuraminate cytidylyltransferase family protein n=1 Tax=Herbaspirillum sp. NPDC101397 TaxID=3364006 RepID=UPI00383ABB86
MINGKAVVGIIAARGGSKGLPGKNWREICGKPLIAWTIEKALKSRYLDVVMVSTDSEEIAAIAVQYGAQVPFLRPPELATDMASSYDVIRHVLAHYEQEGGRQFGYTMLLEPTSPLREDDDIDKVIEALDDNSEVFDSIVTLGAVGEHPSIIKRFAGSEVVPFCPELKQTTRRQDNETAYFPFGVAYLAKTPVLLSENTFYTKRCMGFEIKRYQNYEIDDIYDFLCVETIMKQEWKLK